MSFSVRVLASLTAVLGVVSVGAGCAAPTEDVGTGSAALNANPESEDGFGFTLGVAITKSGSSLTATGNLEDNGLGGTRTAGVCLVTDLGLGKCETIADCDAAAAAAGLPVSNGAFNPNGNVQHYCVAAGSEGQKRCWTRPGGAAGPNGYCRTTSTGADGSIITVTHAATSTNPAIDLSDTSHAWTAVGCLSGPAGGTPVSNPDGFRCQSQVGFDFADHFIKAK